MSEGDKRLREALEAAEEWMAEDGCDCGSDDLPCALCVVREALTPKEPK